jgi:hypothetical protein
MKIHRNVQMQQTFATRMSASCQECCPRYPSKSMQVQALPKSHSAMALVSLGPQQETNLTRPQATIILSSIPPWVRGPALLGFRRAILPTSLLVIVLNSGPQQPKTALCHPGLRRLFSRSSWLRRRRSRSHASSPITSQGTAGFRPNHPEHLAPAYEGLKLAAEMFLDDLIDRWITRSSGESAVVSSVVDFNLVSS